MNRPSSRSHRAQAAGQVGLVIAALAMLIAAPPTTGRMLLVSLDGRAQADMFVLAVASGALPVAAGPVRGSMIVQAPRTGLIGPLFAQGVIPLAAPPGGCGAGSAIAT